MPLTHCPAAYHHWKLRNRWVVLVLAVAILVGNNIAVVGFTPMHNLSLRLLRRRPAFAVIGARRFPQGSTLFPLVTRCVLPLRSNNHDSPLRFLSTFPNMTPQDGNIPKQEQKVYTPYERWVRRLYQTNLFHPVKLGLQNIQQIHELLGSPMDQPNVTVIHVAGTNGKGSVALKIAKTLELSAPSLKVGLFCSPHVSSFRERMQVNGELITEEEVIQYLPRIYDLCETHDIPATFFEITTALAFLFYAQRNVNVVVLETGLGGRLDATNVIASPAVSIITSIGLEHTKILGDTIELIALEKGGIIKPGRPVLVGPHVPHDVLRQCAKDKGAEGYYTCDDVLGVSPIEITDYDQENARIAKAALKLLPQFQIPLEVLEQGTSQRPPCRFEIIEVDTVTVILDVAHNPPAMEYLVRKLKATYPHDKYRFVVGMSLDKDLGQCGRMILEAVNDNVDAIHLVQAAHPRAAELEAMLEAEPRLNGCHWNGSDRSITTQIHSALQMAKQNKELLVVCGSVFLMAESREALGFDEPRDSKYIEEVAGAGFRHGQENFANTDPEPHCNTGV